MDAEPVDNPPLHSGVNEIHFPETEIERGFTYYEQELAEESEARDLWARLISDAHANQEAANCIIGIVQDGKIRWSKEAPRHTSLIMDSTTQKLPPVQFSVEINSLDRKDFIEVRGYDGDLETTKKAALYLKRNLPQLGDTEASIYYFGNKTTNDIYKGPLNEFNA